MQNREHSYSYEILLTKSRWKRERLEAGWRCAASWRRRRGWWSGWPGWRWGRTRRGRRKVRPHTKTRNPSRSATKCVNYQAIRCNTHEIVFKTGYDLLIKRYNLQISYPTLKYSKVRFPQWFLSKPVSITDSEADVVVKCTPDAMIMSVKLPWTDCVWLRGLSSNGDAEIGGAEQSRSSLEKI